MLWRVSCAEPPQCATPGAHRQAEVDAGNCRAAERAGAAGHIEEEEGEG